MSWQVPRLADEIARTEADLTTRLGDLLPASVVSLLARGFCAAVQDLYQFQAWSDRQKSPLTCDDAALDRHGLLWGVPRRGGAAAAGVITISGNEGATLPAATILRRADGTEYATLADAVLPVGGTIDTVEVRATAAGAAANTAAGATLTLLRPVAGLVSAAVVGTDGLAGGVDGEDAPAYRARILDLIRFRPHGGAAQDYVRWALECDGVARAWCFPTELGPGTVVVRFLREGRTNLIPEAGDIAAVQGYIAARAPVTAAITVAAPVAVPLDLEIAVDPDTAAVRAAITAAVADFIGREASPGGTLYRSRLIAEISAAAGEVHHVLISPTEDVESDAGDISVPGAITWS